MRGQTPNRRFIEPSIQNQQIDLQISQGPDYQHTVVNIQSQQGYTEFFSWGNDEDGQLGHGQEDPNRKKIFNLPKSLSFEVLIAQVSCGFAHTAFISKQGYVFSFGSNSDGQLGVNDQAIKYSTAPLLVSDLISMQATPSKIACGGYHTAIISNIGEVYLWGRNIQGQCGRSINYNQFMFTPHKLHMDQSMKQFYSVDCGDLHTALISNTGELFTFGDNSEGQLGIGIEFKNHVDRASLVTGISERAIQVSCGYRHTLVLTDHGTVFGMGSNKRYELGLGSVHKSVNPVRLQALELYPITKIAAGGFSVALTSDNEVLVWGTGEFGQFQTPQKMYMDDIRFVDLTLSKNIDSFGAAVDNNGFVYTWGQNQFGQLGLGDFRFRKLPTKIPQLRKKKVRQIACGGCFVVALGKDVTDGTSKAKKNSKKEKQPSNINEIPEPHQTSQRSKSQVSFGTSSALQHSSLRRKRNDGAEKSQHQTIQNELQKSSLKPTPEHHQSNSRFYNHSQERQAKSFVHSQQPYNDIQHHSQSESLHNSHLNGISQPDHEVSIEKQKRIQLERELKDKEYELMSQHHNRGQNSQMVKDLQNTVNQYKKDNEVLRDALQKEQENSYKLLADIHKSLADSSNYKDQIEDRQRELRTLNLENKRQCERTRELEIENDKIKQENIFVMQRADQDSHKLKQYISDLELALDDSRQQQNTLTQSLKDLQNNQSQSSSHLKSENADLKRQVYNQIEKIKNLEYLNEQARKENEDLKYDNTLLYDKNVQKDSQIVELNNETDKLRSLLDQECSQNAQKTDEATYLVRKLHELETQLNLEKEKNRQKDMQMEDIKQQQDRFKRDMDEREALKKQDLDNLKRALDEQSYECENLRRMASCKQDEISQLNKIISQSSQNNSSLVQTIQELEDTIKDVEEKNKKLNDLLNSTIYNRAEKYKEKVINKLQERPNGHTQNNMMITPNKPQPIFTGAVNESQISENKQYTGQPSPLRLQQILSDEKDKQQRERERLIRLADGMTKNHDLTKSVALPQQNYLQDDASYKRNQQNVSPYSQQNNISPTRANTTVGGNSNSYFNTGAQQNQQQYRRNMPQNELQAQYSGQQQIQQPNARLRLSDLHNAYADSVSRSPNNNNIGYERPQESSPDRIADILKQNSPLRKKIATDALQNRGNFDMSGISNYSPNKSQYTDLDNIRMMGQTNNLYEDENQGNLTASKITHKLVHGELEGLKNRLSNMQKDKQELEQRLNQYESNRNQ